MEIQETKNLVENKEPVSLTTTDTNLVVDRLNKLELLGEAIKSALVEGDKGANDYGILPNTSKPCLFQAGARKIVQLFGLETHFEDGHIVELNNQRVWVVKCILTLNGNVISESNGSSTIDNKRDTGWELNKAIKMSQKRAMVGAVLQVSNLSKIFTQDMEDEQINTPINLNQEGIITKEQGNAFYNKIKFKFSVDNNTTRSIVSKQVETFNQTYGTSYRNVYQFSEEDYKKLLEKAGV